MANMKRNETAAAGAAIAAEVTEIQHVIDARGERYDVDVRLAVQGYPVAWLVVSALVPAGASVPLVVPPDLGVQLGPWERAQAHSEIRRAVLAVVRALAVEVVVAVAPAAPAPGGGQ